MKTRIVFLMFAITNSYIAFASSLSMFALPAGWQKVFTVNAGIAAANGGKSETFFLNPDIEKTYIADKHTQGIASAEAFIGLQHRIFNKALGQLGVSVGSATRAKLSGDIWEDADPDFNNFFYNYKITHTRIALKSKLLADLNYFVQPYLSGSIGIGFNHAYNFTITPKIFEEVPAPGFTAHTTTSFTYTLGFGIQKILSTNWQAGVGYEFANWGKSHLARAPEQNVNSGLSVGHLYTNQLQFSLSYTV